MCGIAGIVSRQQLNYEDLKAHEKLLERRGPDDINSLFFEKNNINFYFLHSRLSIQDTSSRSAQPFSPSYSSNILVYNGEIYNHELLFPKESVFSDTHALFKICDSNIKFLNLLDGFFAFCFYNSNDNILYIGRDQFGVKPLFYYSSDAVFAYSSSLRHLSKIVNANIKVTKKCLLQSAYLGYTHEYSTVYENISKVPPNTLLKINLPCFTIKSSSIYKPFTHNQSINRSPKNYLFYKDLIANALQESVKLQLSNSQRGSSVFLSGGVDSALIAALSSLQSRESDRYVQSFSVISSSIDVDESKRINQVLKYSSFSRISSSQFLFEDFNIISVLNMFANLDYPVLDISLLPTLFLCSMIPRDIRVCLSGDGADELFIGYSRVWDSLNRFRFFRSIPLCSELSSPRLEKYKIAKSPLELRLLFSGVPINYLSECLPSIHGNNHLSELLNYELFYYLPSVLEKVDSASMLHGIEVRVPFLSTNIANIVSQIPLNVLSNPRNPKYILKDILSSFTDQKYPFDSKKGFNLSPILYDLFIRSLNEFNYPELYPNELHLITSKVSLLRLLMLKHWIFNKT